MTPEEAIAQVRKSFPFSGYIDRKEPAILNVARTVLRYLEPGSRILDFGSGPCEKTAVLQLIGYVCSSYDDLRDPWHCSDGNAEKIKAFAVSIGIDFNLAEDDPLPFEAHSFDMVMLHEVLEHLHNSPRALLNKLLTLATPEGYLFVTVPNAANIRKRLDVLRGRSNLPSFSQYYWHPDPWRGHVREYVKKDLEQLSRFLGLDILELRSCHQMIAKMRPALRPIYHGMTCLAPGWRDSWLLVAQKRRGWIPRETAPDEVGQVGFSPNALSGD